MNNLYERTLNLVEQNPQQTPTSVTAGISSDAYWKTQAAQKRIVRRKTPIVSTVTKQPVPATMDTASTIYDRMFNLLEFASPRASTQDKPGKKHMSNPRHARALRSAGISNLGGKSTDVRPLTPAQRGALTVGAAPFVGGAGLALGGTGAAGALLRGGARLARRVGLGGASLAKDAMDAVADKALATDKPQQQQQQQPGVPGPRAGRGRIFREPRTAQGQGQALTGLQAQYRGQR